MLLHCLVLAGIIGLMGCSNGSQPPASSQPTSIFFPQTTVIPADRFSIPTMRISVPDPKKEETAPPSVLTPIRITPVNPPASLIPVNELALPFDPDEIAAILKANPAIHFRYKHRAFVFPNCSTLTHLGEIMELYSPFTEDSLNAPAAPAFRVYAPADMRILKVWGTQRYRLILNTRIGTNSDLKPLYLSLLTVTRLEETLAQKLAQLAGVPVGALALDSQNPLSSVGPYLFSKEYTSDVDDVRAPNPQTTASEDSILIHKGDLVGYKEGPWEWYPTCDGDHTLSLHVFPTTNDVSDQTQAVETFVPEITRYYLNMVVRELVIQRGLTIDIQYRTRNVGHDHSFLAEELFEPEVRAQVSLSPWLMDIHPWRFTVSPASIPSVYIGEDD